MTFDLNSLSSAGTHKVHDFLPAPVPTFYVGGVSVTWNPATGVKHCKAPDGREWLQHPGREWQQIFPVTIPKVKIK